MWHDLRYAVRGLLRAPVFTIVASISLALAIGANATIFSLIDGIWFRPPGVDSPGNLVRIFSTTPDTQTGPFSFPEYRDVREHAKGLSAIVAVGRRGALLRSADGSSELLLANVVSMNFFSALGVRPGVGRLFSPGDEASLEQQPAVVLGYAFWQRRFGGDRSIVGRTLTLMRGQKPVQVVVRGVLPPTFRELDASSDRDLWLPPPRRGCNWATATSSSSATTGGSRCLGACVPASRRRPLTRNCRYSHAPWRRASRQPTRDAARAWFPTGSTASRAAA